MIHRTISWFLLAVAIVMACNGTALGQSSPPPPNARSPLGTNFGPIADWSPEWPFVDAFRNSRPWVSGTARKWDDGRTVSTDASGWVNGLLPGQIARTAILTGRLPGGTYIVLYEGAGTIEYGGAATLDANLSRPGRHVLQVDPAKGGIMLSVTALPIRNIRVIMPGGACSGDPFRYAKDSSDCGNAGYFISFESSYAKSIFHPQFLESVRAYRSLRFMNWGRTSDSKQASWSDRPKMTDARWSTDRGAPVEVMIELANRIGSRAWFSLPHLADDDYVRQYARLVKQRLLPGLKAYVEYSNEVWNSLFAQAAYARTQGEALGLSTNPLQAQMRFYSRRSVQVFDIWAAEFADPKRLVRVMAAQSSNTWTAIQALDFESASKKTDALAIAPYFGVDLGLPKMQDRVRAMSLNTLFTELEAVAIPQSLGMMKNNAAVASARGIALIGYEGGQHLVGVGPVQSDDVINALFDSANRDARMGPIYRKYLDGWKAAGGTLLHHFVNVSDYSRFGRWGALEFLTQARSNAPKYDALRTFIEENPTPE